MNWGNALGGAAIALGLAIAGWTGGAALIEARAPERIVSVKGLAERAVDADIAVWRIPFRGQGATPAQAVAEASRARDAVRAFARDGGLAEADIAEEPFALRAERTIVENGAADRFRHFAVGALRIRTTDVETVARLSGRTLDLLERGVAIGETEYAEAPRPHYAFTGLNAIKPDMITEATRAARDSAERFAADSGARVGEIIRANQGVVQILPPEGGGPEPLERSKRVRIVASVDYRLID